MTRNPGVTCEIADSAREFRRQAHKTAKLGRRFAADGIDRGRIEHRSRINHITRLNRNCEVVAVAGGLGHLDSDEAANAVRRIAAIA